MTWQPHLPNGTFFLYGIVCSACSHWLFGTALARMTWPRKSTRLVLTNAKSSLLIKTAILAFNPAFYNVPVSQLSPRQQAYNRQPHCTYLAYFGPGVVKVGIALQKRVLKRWLEQGARAVMILQTTKDAYQARELEAQVSETLHIPERITVAKKKQLLHVPYRWEEAALALAEHQEAIAQALLLQEAAHDAVQDLQPHYFPVIQPQPLLDAGQRQQSVAGRVVGMVGDLVVYEAGGRFWMSALKKYIGSAYVHLSAAPLATQTAFNFAQPA